MMNPHVPRTSPRTDIPGEDGQTLQTQHDSGPPSDEAFGETLAPSQTDLRTAVQPLRNIAGYEVLSELGRGGMGVVYKARQKGLNRLVALKMILHAEHAGADERARFQREAAALGNLRHENIVQVYEVGEHEGKPFFSLEFVEGGSLDRLLRAGPLKQQEAAALVDKLAAAIQSAHEAGIIHRDLKPANVLLQSGGRKPPVSSQDSDTGGLRPPLGDVPKITDFGLAKKLDEAGLSASGAVMGTPSYMAPEQAAGKINEMDARTDVYALGAILYECLTGRPPFRAATVMDTLMQVMGEEAVAVRSLQPTVHPDLETICHKCLQKEAGRRYASARALAEDLERFQRGEPVSARPVGRLERGWRWCRRNPMVASLLAAVFLLLVGGTTISTAFAIAEGEARRDADTNADLEKAARIQAQTAEANEKQERIKARDAEQKEKLARGVAEKEEKLAKARLYVHRLALVQSYWNEGNVQAARDTLEESYDQRDTWEYRYLNHLINHQGQRTYRGHTGIVSCVSFSPDGTRIVSAGGDETLKVWDAAGGQELLSITGYQGGVVAFSPDGARVVGSSYEDNTLSAWDAKTGRVLPGVKGDPSFGKVVAISPDGKRLVSVSADRRTVRLWDVQSRQVLLTLAGYPLGNAVSFNADGTRLAVGGTWGADPNDSFRTQWGETRVWDIKTGETDSRPGETSVFGQPRRVQSRRQPDRVGQ